METSRPETSGPFISWFVISADAALADALSSGLQHRTPGYTDEATVKVRTDTFLLFFLQRLKFLPNFGLF